MIKKFNQFLNENILDKMSGPTKEEILKTHPEKLLKIAVQDNDFELVKLSIDGGANVHYDDEYSLLKASENNNIEMIKYLIEHGANVNADFNRVFRDACDNNEFELADYLIEHGANPRSEGDYPLRYAAEGGNLEALKYLISKGSDVYSSDNYAFRQAIKQDRLNIVEFLNENYNIVKNSDDKEKYLKSALYERSYEVSKYFLENGFDIKLIDNIGSYMNRGVYTSGKLNELIKKYLNR